MLKPGKTSFAQDFVRIDRQTALVSSCDDSPEVEIDGLRRFEAEN
jgi:hypothetical protein